MEQDCQPVSVPGWERYETQQCTYRVTNHAVETSKAATVVMLNPSARKLSEWIINACTRALPGHDLQTCAQRVFDHVLSPPGGQYPVAGIVYEDLLPENTPLARVGREQPSTAEHNPERGGRRAQD